MPKQPIAPRQHVCGVILKARSKSYLAWIDNDGTLRVAPIAEDTHVSWAEIKRQACDFLRTTLALAPEQVSDRQFDLVTTVRLFTTPSQIQRKGLIEDNGRCYQLTCYQREYGILHRTLNAHSQDESLQEAADLIDCSTDEIDFVMYD